MGFRGMVCCSFEVLACHASRVIQALPFMFADEPVPTNPFGAPVLIRPILDIGPGVTDICSVSDGGNTLYVTTYFKNVQTPTVLRSIPNIFGQAYLRTLLRNF